MEAPPIIRMRDGKVYYGDTLVEGVSPTGFECLADDRYGLHLRDEKGIWHFFQYGAEHGTCFVTANAERFRLLGHGYSTDGDTVFLKGRPIKSAQPSSFRAVNRTFAADDGAVYIDNNMAEGFQIWKDFDAASIEFFHEDMGRPPSTFADRFHLYTFNHHFVEYCDPHVSRWNKYRKELQQRRPDAKAWWNLADGFQNHLTPIGENFFTDGGLVFYRFEEKKQHCCQYNLPLRGDSYLILPNADPQSFQALNSFYGLDDAAVFCCAKKIDADRSTFEALKGEFGRDRTGIWFNGIHDPKIDGSNLRVHTSPEYTFALAGGRVYKAEPVVSLGRGKGYARQLRLEKKADAESFEVVNDTFAKDKNHVYWCGEVWKGVDPATFRIVAKNSNFEFAIDRHHLYRTQGKVTYKKVDGASFEMLNAHWAKDKKSIIFMGREGEIVREADYESFEVLGDDGSAQDARRRYWVDVLGWDSDKR